MLLLSRLMHTLFNTCCCLLVCYIVIIYVRVFIFEVNSRKLLSVIFFIEDVYLDIVQCSAGESVERYLDEICSSPGSVQPVLSCLPPPPIEYLHVLQVLVLLPPEPGGGHPAHHGQLPVQGGHRVASPRSGETRQVNPPTQGKC